MPRHPLQRLSSPSRSFSLILHLLGVASFSYSFHFLTIWDNPLSDAYGWHFQFLTIIGLAAALLSFVCGAAADLSGSPVLFRAKNYISVVATPLEFVISILYWGLSLIDPHLVVPPEFQLPLHADVGFHLAPAVFLSLDLLLCSPPWTVPAYGFMALSTTLAFSYWYWIELCYSKNGWYPYPIFEMLSTTQRTMLFAVSALLTTLSSMILKFLYAKLNGFEAGKREAYKPAKKLQ